MLETAIGDLAGRAISSGGPCRKRHMRN